MKRIFTILLTFVLLGMTCVGCAPPQLGQPSDDSDPTKAEPKKVLITDQQGRALSIYDLNVTDWSKPEWTWTTEHKNFTNVSGAKYRYDPHSKMDVIAFCCSGGYCGIISYPLGEVIAYVDNAGGNPHSVEVLPDGALVVAASTGSYVRIYDTTFYGDVSKKYTQIYFPDAHGVLWDPVEEVLWVAGTNRLWGYTVSADHTMTLRDDLKYHLPDGGAHDLQPVYGQPDCLWVSTGSHILQVNKKTGESSTRYEGWHMISATANVKGLGNFEDKTFVFAQMANVWKEWNTDTITVGHYNEEEGRYYLEPRKLPKGVAYYKLRVFKKDYL
ncbi:MAG: hypothetical protein IIW31_05255 [Clostridia bacterium]|nr:hypothetical protein [Clostridia bacterium]